MPRYLSDRIWQIDMLCVVKRRNYSGSESLLAIASWRYFWAIPYLDALLVPTPIMILNDVSTLTIHDNSLITS